MNNLKAIKRDTVTSGQLNKLRESGFIPAILYGGKDPNAKISIEKKNIKNVLNSESFLSTVLELDVDGTAAARSLMLILTLIPSFTWLSYLSSVKSPCAKRGPTAGRRTLRRPNRCRCPPASSSRRTSRR